MIPRKRLDLTAGLVVRGLWNTLTCWRSVPQARRVERLWDNPESTVALYSVRTGFDLLLQALAFEPGDEVLFSAVNIPDMTRIAAHHGLTSVPVDIDPATLAPNLESLERAWSPRARMLVVAHLFGARVRMEPLVDWARRRRILLVEDAAQAYGPSFRGHAESDVRFFSFGPVKTATALGGAIASFRDAQLAESVRRIEQSYPFHPRRLFFRRVVLLGLAGALARPALYGAFTKFVERRGVDLDEFLSRWVLRGYFSGDFLHKIRRRPPAAMLALLVHRLAKRQVRHVERRVELARRLFASMPNVGHPGWSVDDHVHWICPILSQDPEGLRRHLWSRGFDATRGLSSLSVIDPPTGRPELEPKQARAMMGQIVYLPFDWRMSEQEIDRLSAEVAAFEAHVAVSRQHRPQRQPEDVGTRPAA